MSSTSGDVTLTAGKTVGIGSQSTKLHTETCARLFTEEVFFARDKNWKQIDCSSFGYWMDKIWQMTPWNVIKKLEVVT